MRILTVPDNSPALRQKSQAVKAVGRNLVKFMAEMGKALASQRDPEGVGLSAVQVGRPVRIFALNHKYLDKTEGGRIVFYINPKIIGYSKEETWGKELTKKGEPFLEGCLSVPDLYGEVRRRTEISVAAMILKEADLDQSYELPITDYRLRFTGLAARVFQHELDHLNGILFTERVMAQKGRLYRLNGKNMEIMEL